MKVAYFGLPLGALLLLQDGHELCRAVISPIAAPGLRRLRARLGPRVVLGGSESDAVLAARLALLQPDLIISWYYTHLIPQTCLDLARSGAIGAHPSLLPRHRGPNPFFWAIDSGDPDSGVSVHRLLAQYDTGSILAACSIPIGQRNAWQLARALDRPSLRLLRETALKVARGEPLTETPQDEELATWAPEPSGPLLSVQWNWPTARVLQRIRALSPVPGLALEVHGLCFFITEATTVPEMLASLEPGEAAVVRWNGTLRLALRCLNGTVLVEAAAAGSTNDNPGVAEGEPLSGTELAEALLRQAPGMLNSVVRLGAP